MNLTSPDATVFTRFFTILSMGPRICKSRCGEPSARSWSRRSEFSAAPVECLGHGNLQSATRSAVDAV